jgi:uncharacterized protein YuzE
MARLVDPLFWRKLAMQELYLEVTFRHGEPLAGYLYLPRLEEARSSQVKKFGPGLLVDLDQDGKPIGIEIAMPASVTIEAVNEILESYGMSQVDPVELAPLKKAA